MKRLLTSTLILGATMGVSSAQAEELTFGVWGAPSGYLSAVALPNALAKIEAEAPEIKWNLVTGGQLAGGKETFPAIQDGIMDAGFGFPPYVPNLLPSIAMLYEIVVPGDDPVVAAGAAVETVMLHCPSCLEEAAAMDQIPFGGFATAPYQLMCTTPIASVEDLKGKRVRASGASLVIVEMAGASGVSASLSDAVSLLQRGGLDCVAGAGEWIKTYGFGDFAKYVTDYSLGISAPGISFMMNRDKWNAMTDEEKQVHLKTFASIGADMTVNNFKINSDKIMEEAVANDGVTLVEAGDDFDKLMADYAGLETEKSIERAKKFGVEDPATLIATYREMVTKWQGIAEQIDGKGAQAFEDALWSEVYSKVDPNSF
ncbi:C4-dicarboxylate TRAP transporter substrate-binding protein [Sagittula stellata]|uniref:TRAP-T family transporter, DctP (Periplasmic binding) subunit n=1 Tax=Sagittula stellata (strain ATCC 700073 / DSM 11524 / E-37) TaxID=388399 RepID=A3K492_SAGS3|nr:C4-dicarboxylate TRAP transporter substrate-binding protein [Sagittula stellata]EBA07791.1 TRAP-T family transporter, DctP (periplasmic binding) subunit [Sagittula stellata E-37]